MEEKNRPYYSYNSNTFDTLPRYRLTAPESWNFIKDCNGIVWSRSEWNKLSVLTRRDRLPIVRGYAVDYVNQGLEEANDICTKKLEKDGFLYTDDACKIANKILRDKAWPNTSGFCSNDICTHVELKLPWDEYRTEGYAHLFEDNNEDAKKLSKAPVCIGYEPCKGTFVSSLAIDRVIFNDPATIIIWTDGTKTVVKCGENDTFDPEKGFAIAVVKKLFGNHSRYYNEFKKWIPVELENEDGNEED